MKKRTVSFCLVVGMMISVFSPIVGEAATLEEIKLQQQSKQSEMILLDNQINSKLEEVNEKNAELEIVEEEIATLEVTVEETAQAIEEQEEVVAERVDQAKERLKTIQTNEVNQNTVVSLIESESVTDFLNRAYVLITLQSAGNDQVESAQEEANELEKLEEKHAAKITELEKQSLLAEQQKEEVATELAGLQETMDENKALLDKLDEERSNEETRIAEEKERVAQEAAEKAALAEKAKEEEKAEQAEVVATQTSKTEKTAPAATNVTVQEETKTTDSKPETKVETKTEAQPTPEKAASSSKTVVVSATGYSTQQAGLSTHTAMGIDLTKNPNVIAVDPSVIPLGSKVEVPGFGVFIAGDTGGAIKGNKIDIHFSSVQQALNWGRRTITVKILD